VGLRVEHEGEAQKAIAAAAARVGGRVLWSSGGDVRLTVPRDRYRELVTELRGLGELQYDKLGVRDATRQYAEALANLESARAASARRRQLRRVPGSVQEKLVVERVVEGSIERIRVAEARVRDIAERAEYAELRVVLLYEPRAGVEHSALPFSWLDELGLARLQNPPSHVPGRSRAGMTSLTEIGLGVTTFYVPNAEPLGGTKLAMGLGFGLRSLGDSDPVGFFGGMDLSLGASQGFVYGLQVLLGAGLPIGRRLVLGVSAGPGIDGITTVVPFSVLFPVEVYVGWDVASFMNVSLRAHHAFATADARRDGAAHALFGDELFAGVVTTLAERDSWTAERQKRGGWSVGAGYRELMGTEMVGLWLGFSATRAEYVEEP
jgi:hypothetical protein